LLAMASPRSGAMVSMQKVASTVNAAKYPTKSIQDIGLHSPLQCGVKIVSAHKINEGTYPSLAVLINDIAAQVKQYGSIAKSPASTVCNTRNDMYLVSEAIRFLMKDKESDLSNEEVGKLNAYKGSLDNATKFIPNWVKIVVACPCLREDVVPAARRRKLLFADLALVADAKELEHIVVTVLMSKKAAGILIERLLSTQQLVFLGAAV